MSRDRGSTIVLLHSMYWVRLLLQVWESGQDSVYYYIFHGSAGLWAARLDRRGDTGRGGTMLRDLDESSKGM